MREGGPGPQLPRTWPGEANSPLLPRTSRRCRRRRHRHQARTNRGNSTSCSAAAPQPSQLPGPHHVSAAALRGCVTCRITRTGGTGCRPMGFGVEPLGRGVGALAGGPGRRLGAAEFRDPGTSVLCSAGALRPRKPFWRILGAWGLGRGYRWPRSVTAPVLVSVS